MQAASRQSLAEATKRLDQHASGAKAAELTKLGDELFAVSRLLGSDRGLRRALADSATDPDTRTGLADRLLNGKVGAPTLDLVKELTQARWSQPRDLGDATESLARDALLSVAEADGSLDEVEDELFRFGRILESEPELRTHLVARDVPAEKRAELLKKIIGTKVRPITAQLLENAVRAPQGRNVDTVIEQLAEQAAARRGRSVAHVTSAVALTDAQQTRLSEVLSRIYGRAVGLQVEVDPDLLGGLKIQVGDEVIDGTVASRLAEAKQRLPR